MAAHDDGLLRRVTELERDRRAVWRVINQLRSQVAELTTAAEIAERVARETAAREAWIVSKRSAVVASLVGAVVAGCSIATVILALVYHGTVR